MPNFRKIWLKTCRNLGKFGLKKTCKVDLENSWLGELCIPDSGSKYEKKLKSNF